MKYKKIIIFTLIFIAIILIGGVFAIQLIDLNPSSEVFENNVINPDRIVYRNEEGKYFEFHKDSAEYKKLLEQISKSIKNYNKNGESLSDEQIDEIRSQPVIEFDYKTASKNYLIPLKQNQGMIKLADIDGHVVTEKIKNISKIRKICEVLAQDTKEYSLEYKEMISRNYLETMQYKYLQQFKEISYKIHQVKIQDMETYKLYQAMCRLAFDEEITEKTFEDYDLILTVSLLPKINVKVNIGNIKYTYETMEDVYFQYTAHLLMVSKIVNTDCIYNTDLAEIEAKVKDDEMKLEYDNKVESIDTELFATDYQKFLEEYEKATTTISKEDASKIAEKGFEEAERIVGSYEKSTEKVKSESVKPNNFFTSKISDGHTIAEKSVEVYSFTRVDDMELNGVTIYIDKRLGKIVGGAAFGD